ARAFTQGALERLYAHSWPGNVRELRNVMEQTAVFASGYEVQPEEVQLVSTHVVAPAARTPGVSSVAHVPPPTTSAGGAGVAAPPSPLAPFAALARSTLGAIAANHSDDALVLRFPIGTTVEEAEKQLILRTLEVIGGNKQKAARVLGISRRCLYNKLASYGI